MLEAFGPWRADLIEDGKDQERGEALRGRRHVVNRAGAQARAQGRYDLRLVRFEIGKPQRAACSLEVARHAARDVAIIEVGKARVGKASQGAGELGLKELRARSHLRGAEKRTEA